MSGGVCLKNISSKDESYTLGGLLLAAFRGVLFGIGGAALLALVMTAVALMTKDPDKLVGILAYAALLIGAFVCGVTALRSDENHSIAAPLIGGAGYVLVLWLVSLFFRGDTVTPVPPIWMAVGYAVCVLISLVGGLIARPRRMRVGEGKNSPAAQIRRQLGRRV